MARLPTPGADSGNWGDILNDYLQQSHNVDGSLKPTAITAAIPTDGSVSIAKSQLSAAVQASLNNADAAVSGTAPDASSSTKGLVRLTGDLGGTAAAPTVPGLAGKVSSSSVGAASGVASLDGNSKLTASQLPDIEQLLAFTKPGTLAVSAGATRMVIPRASVLVGVQSALGTAASQDLICDLNIDGTTVFTDQSKRPTITTGQLKSTLKTPDVTSLPAGSVLTVDVDQVGTPTQIAFVNSNVTTGVATSNPQITRPSGSATGDILVAAVRVSRVASSAATSIATPTGWNFIGVATTTLATQDVHYFWRRDEGASTNAGPWTFPTTVPSGGGTFTDSMVLVYRNCIATGSPIDGTAGIAALGWATNHVGPSVTTTTVGGILLHLAKHGTGTTWTTDVGMTRRATTGTNTWFASELILSVAGATGAKTAVAAASDWANDMTIALKADPSTAQPGQDLTVSIIIKGA